MEARDLPSVLARSGFAREVVSAEHVVAHGHRYANLYKIACADGVFACKVRSKEDSHVADSIERLREMDDAEDLVQRYDTVIADGDRYLLISRWIDGVQPMHQSRRLLPEFFARLARFNLRNPHAGPYTSMYLDGREFGSIGDMVAWELGSHGEPARRRVIAELTRPLKNGLACVTFEDANPGNMIVTTDGRHVLIDTEYLHAGLNLHQFDHVDPFSDDAPWHAIHGEASDCLVAYFDELSVSKDEANAQARAFFTLSALRTRSYERWKGENADSADFARAIQRISGYNVY